MTGESMLPWAENRDKRALYREFLRDFSTLDRVRKCGVVCRRPEGVGIVADMSVAVGERVAGFRGLVRCGSPSACPRCARVIGAYRSAQIIDGLRRWHSEFSGQALFMTLTMSRGRLHRLDRLWDRLIKAWAKLQMRKSWRDLRFSGGISGVIRAVEATHKEDRGWHVHLHVLIFTTDLSALLLAWPTVDRDWIGICSTLGASASSDAQDLAIADMDHIDRLGAYVAKGGWTIADETVRHDVKSGRGGSSSPLDLLERACMQGDADAADLWAEWEQATVGRRQLEASRWRSIPVSRDGVLVTESLTEALGISLYPGDAFVDALIESSDSGEGAAADSAGAAIVASVNRGTEEVAGLTARDFSALRATDANVLLEAVETAEADDQEALQNHLDSAAAFLGVVVMVGQDWGEHVSAAPKSKRRATYLSEHEYTDSDDVLGRLSAFVNGEEMF